MEPPKSKRIRVNCANAGRTRVWLVKVPKYLSEKWQDAAGNREVGKLSLLETTNEKGEQNVIFVSADAASSGTTPIGLAGSSNQSVGNGAASSRPGTMPSVRERLQASGGLDMKPLGKASSAKDATPGQHDFIMNPLRDQSLALICEDKSNLEDPEDETGALSVDGKVVKRAECRPSRSDDAYFSLKKGRIQTHNEPTRKVQQMEKAVQKFLPRNVHVEAVARQNQKRDGAKSVRGERDQVMDMLFKAFEQHQYYRLVDLQTVTKQPPGFLKEILSEIARYNTAYPHKAMWELKPEYRHYKQDEKTEKS